VVIESDNTDINLMPMSVNDQNKLSEQSKEKHKLSRTFCLLLVLFLIIGGAVLIIIVIKHFGKKSSLELEDNPFVNTTSELSE
jgi:hypothetical protein